MVLTQATHHCPLTPGRLLVSSSAQVAYSPRRAHLSGLPHPGPSPIGKGLCLCF